MSRFSFTLTGVVAAAICCFTAFDAAAQFSMPGGPRRAGPEPGNNREMAMTGRQIVGLAGKCLQLSGRSLIMGTCDPNSISQRFKFEGGRIKTAGVIVLNDFNFARDEAWMNACISIGDRDHLVYLAYCRPSDQGGGERQIFSFNGREIRGYGNQCLDVLNERTDVGAPVIYWGCHGHANQQWAWR